MLYFTIVRIVDISNIFFLIVKSYLRKLTQYGTVWIYFFFTGRRAHWPCSQPFEVSARIGGGNCV